MTHNHNWRSIKPSIRRDKDGISMEMVSGASNERAVRSGMNP